MKTADEILSMVNEFLANLPYERKPKSLYEPIRYVLSMGQAYSSYAHARY